MRIPFFRRNCSIFCLKKKGKSNKKRCIKFPRCHKFSFLFRGKKEYSLTSFTRISFKDRVIPRLPPDQNRWIGTKSLAPTWTTTDKMTRQFSQYFFIDTRVDFSITFSPLSPSFSWILEAWKEGELDERQARSAGTYRLNCPKFGGSTRLNLIIRLHPREEWSSGRSSFEKS